MRSGDTIEGKYVLRQLLGAGGMGSVFLAEHPALERTLAIKVLHPALASSAAYVRRMRDEAVAACRVRSPHSVAVLDHGALSDGTPYLVMEHVPGRSLGRILDEETLPLPRVVALFEQALEALASAHDAGIVHCDVKSDNFLVELCGGAEHVTLIDFGLARPIGATPAIELDNGERIISGTPEYVAPERIRGAAAMPSADLYSAGVLLYELLTGTPPFLGETTEELIRQHTGEPAPPPSRRRPDRDIPPALDDVVLRALAKRPEERFQDARAFARALRAALPPARAARPPVPRYSAITRPARGSVQGALRETCLAPGGARRR